MMTSPSNVERLIRDTRRYEYADGLRDLQLAVYFVLSSVAVWLVFQPFWVTLLRDLVGKYGRGASWLGMLLLLIAPLAVIGMLGLMNFVRKRWLWRESGMVKPSRWFVPRRVTVLSTVILVGGLALAILARHQGWVKDNFILLMLWAASGWSFAYTLISMGRELDLSRYIWLGAIGGALSTILLFIQLTFPQAALVFGLFWGLLLSVSGIVTLRRSIDAKKAGE
jgi:hypothetical protein